MMRNNRIWPFAANVRGAPLWVGAVAIAVYVGFILTGVLGR